MNKPSPIHSKCIKGRKCDFSSVFRGRGHFICIGFLHKPLKYKKDIINFCLEGKYTKNFSLQMTCKEALLIGTGLLNTIGIE